MFRPLKGTRTGEVKPAVTLRISINGAEVEPTQLSGGEKERVSMALTMSLMMMSASPIVLMDEMLASLDEDSREMALESLARYGRTSERALVCVNHGGSTGWYDKKITLGEPEASA